MRIPIGPGKSFLTSGFGSSKFQTFCYILLVKAVTETTRVPGQKNRLQTLMSVARIHCYWMGGGSVTTCGNAICHGGTLTLSLVFSESSTVPGTKLVLAVP